MKISIPKTIMTPQGEVNILPYPSRDKYMKGLVDGWKVGFREATMQTQAAFEEAGFDKGCITGTDIEFIEGEE